MGVLPALSRRRAASGGVPASGRTAPQTAVPAARRCGLGGQLRPLHGRCPSPPAARNAPTPRKHAEPREFSAGATDSRATRGEQILLDGDAEAEDKSYYRIGGRGHSFEPPAVRVDRRREWLGVLHAASEGSRYRKAELDDVIERCSGGFVWAADHRDGVLHRARRPSPPVQGAAPPHWHRRRGRRRRLRRALTPVSSSTSRSRESRRFVVIDAHDHVTSEVRLIDAARPESAPILVAARDPMTEYDVSHHGDYG